MAVRIRLTKIGRTHSPFYRIGAYDSRAPRNGKCLEYLGWYNPCSHEEDNQLRVKLERVQHWLSVGALPTHKTGILLKKAGIVLNKPKVKKASKEKAAKPKGKKAKKQKKS